MPVVNGSALLESKYIGNWAGYADFPPGGAAGMECVQGSITIPTAFTIPNGETRSANYLFIWVGIGGLAGNQSLWQGGMWIEQSVSQNTTFWRAATDAVTGGFGNAQYWSSANYTLPSSMTAKVCTVTSGLDIYILTFYGHNGWEGVWSGALTTPFFPNEGSAEWIVESPNVSGDLCYCWGIPRFSSMTWSEPIWTDLAGTYNTYLDALGSFALDDTACGCGSQFVNPSSLVHVDTQFWENYTT